MCVFLIAGPDDLGDAVQDIDLENAEDPEMKDAEVHDFDYQVGDGDNDEDDIPHDIDGWDFALSDSDVECGDDPILEKESKTNTKDPSQVATLRPEYVECKTLGLIVKPPNSTLGVHIGQKQWRSSYLGAKHYGRTWGTKRSPRKALLEVIKCILEDHCSTEPGDKFAKKQLTRVSKAWLESD